MTLAWCCAILWLHSKALRINIVRMWAAEVDSRSTLAAHGFKSVWCNNVVNNS